MKLKVYFVPEGALVEICGDFWEIGKNEALRGP